MTDPGRRIADDLERLANIGDQVVAGSPIEDFELGESEVFFVAAYVRRAWDEIWGHDDN